jgi:hypothetical protein
MTRLPFTAITFACTTRTDTQNAHSPIHDRQILRFQVQLELLTTGSFYGWQQSPRRAKPVTENE